jgi:hypothetical protein
MLSLSLEKMSFAYYNQVVREIMNKTASASNHQERVDL